MATSSELSTHKKGLYKVYYDEFQEFIKDVCAQEPENYRQGSREVLKTMPEPGFSELATDLYEEVLRRKAINERQDNANATLPAPRKDYHPKRNETRIKLASAPVTKIESLVSDIYHELNRRFPEFRTLTVRPKA